MEIVLHLVPVRLVEIDVITAFKLSVFFLSYESIFPPTQGYNSEFYFL